MEFMIVTTVGPNLVKGGLGAHAIEDCMEPDITHMVVTSGSYTS
jgi:hypothetical protein